jgi:hypothetical protein
MSITVNLNTLARGGAIIPKTVCGELLMDRRCSPDFLKSTYENTSGATFVEAINDYQPGSLGFPAAGHSQLAKYIFDQSQHAYWRGGTDSPLTTDPDTDGHTWDVEGFWDDTTPSSLNDISITKGGNVSEILRIADFAWLFNNTSSKYFVPVFFTPWRAGVADGKCKPLNWGLQSKWKNPEGKQHPSGTAMTFSGGGAGVSIMDTPTHQHMTILNKRYADLLWGTGGLGFPTATGTGLPNPPGIVHFGGEDWGGWESDIDLRAVDPTVYAAGTTYAQGARVVDASITYRSLLDGNTGHTPASNPTWWVNDEGGQHAWEPPPWVTGKSYLEGQRVYKDPAGGTNYNIYRCDYGHTSTASFTTDLANTGPGGEHYWVLESAKDKVSWIASRMAYFFKDYYNYVIGTNGGLKAAWTNFKWMSSFQESNASGRIMILPQTTCYANQKAVAKMLGSDGGIGGSKLGDLIHAMDFSGQYRKLWEMWKNTWVVPTPGQAFYESYNPTTNKTGKVSVTAVTAPNGSSPYWTATITGGTGVDATAFATDYSGWNGAQAPMHVVIGPVDVYTDPDTHQDTPVYLEGEITGLTAGPPETMTVKFAPHAVPPPHWHAGFIYNVGMRIIGPDGMTYVCAVAHTSNTDALLGFYDDLKIVPALWTSEASVFPNPANYAGDWVSGTQYKTTPVTDYVTHNGGIYKCIANFTTSPYSTTVPGSDPTHFQLEGPASTSAWSYTKSTWKGVGLVHARRDPVDPVNDFNDGEHIRLSWMCDKTFDPAAWSSTTTYTQGQLVLSGGNVYVATSAASNLNHVPPNATYWSLIGAQSAITKAGNGTLWEIRDWWSKFMTYLSGSGANVGGSVPDRLNIANLVNVDVGLMAWSVGDVWDTENSVSLASRAAAAGLEMEEWQAGLVAANYLMELIDSGWTYALGFSGFGGDRCEGTGPATSGNTGGQTDTQWKKNPMFQAKKLISQIIVHQDCYQPTYSKTVGETLVPCLFVKWTETPGGVTHNYLGVWCINKNVGANKNITFKFPAATRALTEIATQYYDQTHTGVSSATGWWSAGTGFDKVLNIPKDTLVYTKFEL